MGLLDRLTGGANESDDGEDETENEPDRWQIVTRDDNGQRAGHPDGVESGEWTFKGEPPTKQQFLFEYGDVLDPGVEYLCLISETGGSGGRFNFDRIRWTHEEEQTYQRDETDEIAQLIDQKLDDTGMPSGDQPFEDRLLEAVIMGQVDFQTAEQVVGLKSELEKAKNPTNKNFLESADITEPTQLAAGGLANMMSNYDSIGDAVEDVIGGAVRAGPAASLSGGGGGGGGEQDQPPAVPGELDETPGDADADPEPEPETPQSSAAAAHADRIAEMAADSEVRASGEVVERAAGDVDADADAADDRGWTAEDVPESPDEVAEELAEDFPAEPVTAHEPGADAAGEGDADTETDDTADGESAEDAVNDPDSDAETQEVDA